MYNHNNRYNQMEDSSPSGRAGRPGGYGESDPGAAKPPDTPQHLNAFTMIPPNDRKRQQVAQMNQQGEEHYRRYKEDRKMGHVSCGGRLGGEGVSLEQARVTAVSQQRRAKMERLQRTQQHKEEKRRREGEEIQRKLDEQRRKTEMNKLREERERQEIDKDRRKMNEAFLDRLEGKSEKKPESGAVTMKCNNTKPGNAESAYGGPIERLVREFPGYDKDILAQILIEHSGSVNDVIALLR